ncbi:hypothetical protein H6G97_30640 [Nostoc flagelliforme FACHB-838]|uniref:Transposase n=1 Tax=Nostoc flagelliforme FACHB-838 TaxID=2692904 RepID=A0ABR8DW30_9NOSO|nr:hypothetical protein [Nostoc flagelliforme FACHB-838]
MLGLFLAADGKPLPHYSKSFSVSALSRFLNTYKWPTASEQRLGGRQPSNLS